MACSRQRPIFELRLLQRWRRRLLRKVWRDMALLHARARLLAVATLGGEGRVGRKLILDSRRVDWIYALVLLSSRERVALPMARNVGVLLSCLRRRCGHLASTVGSPVGRRCFEAGTWSHFWDREVVPLRMFSGAHWGGLVRQGAAVFKRACFPMQALQ